MENVICPVQKKRCYTQKEAGDCLRLAKKKTNRKGYIPKRSYYCRDCGYYHLTSRADAGTQENHKPLKILNVQEDFDLSEVFI